ncbi:tripartite tricarboxylate transporter substrate binding protein [Roseomonas sp. OT10]|uniref:Bug family tripartite tricarboxylate transporter substrate binding protein n=1 Tax=Roseomonas cutis TaxID=2897332 RepID=UPI001E60852D|nr:tripartite tricarboxylate transporter substrate binding protein [Roseomonas sp. OT10]UFN47208.1 tripartite tricarboxylate transporter substrate binding protein [Roseomonas sp. OT10]
MPHQPVPPPSAAIADARPGGSRTPQHGPTRRGLLPLAVLAASGLAARPGQAQEAFPSRPVTLVVAYAPGGSTDLIARVVAEGMAKQLGQPVVVENRAGASGAVGHASVARAKPDGYTILLSGRGNLAMLPHMMPNRSYDETRDFTAIGMLGETPIYLCVNPKVGVRDVAGLIALAKAKPGKLNYASAGSGTSAHIASELFLGMAGIEVQNITYRGGGPAVQALISGEVEMAFVDAVTAVPLMRNGQVQGLAVGSAERVALTPEVPTIAETLPGYEISSLFAVVAPAGTPPAAIRRLYDAMATAMRDPALLERLQAAVFLPRLAPPEVFTPFIQAESARWGELIRTRGITME